MKEIVLSIASILCVVVLYQCIQRWTSKFIIYRIWSHSNRTIKIKGFPIHSDPSFSGYDALVTKKENVTFEEVVEIFTFSLNGNDYLGAMALIYWKYYNEFYDFFVSISQDPVCIKKYKWAVKKFNRKHLRRWIEFVKYSDDTMYPQNEVFRKMDALVQKMYFRENA